MFLPNPGILSAGATSAPPSGQFMRAWGIPAAQQYVNLTVPAGVTSVCAVVIGRGERLLANHTSTRGGRGGNLRYVNDIAVTPGEVLQLLFTDAGYSCLRRLSGSYEILVAAGDGGTNSSLNIGTGFDGGVSSTSTSKDRPGGGAGGYTSAGSSLNTNIARGGQGSDPYGRRLTGGGVRTADDYVGEHYGGGAGKSIANQPYNSAGGSGCIRVIWGPGRAFPNTLTEDM